MRVTHFIALAVITGLLPGSALGAQGHRAGVGGGTMRRSPAPGTKEEPENTPVDEFERMPPEQQQKALAKLPPERRKKVEQQLARLRSLPPEQRAMLRHAYGRLSDLPPDRQQAVRRAFEKFSNQPADRRQAIREELKQMGNLPPDERTSRLKNKDFRQSFNHGEQQIIRDMADLLPRR